jgi:pimeloyl-ACP methyl ester carboxylesterase
MSNYVQLGDVHTYYEEDGAGEALVLLRPGLAHSQAFEEYVPEFAHHFHFLQPDRRGHGSLDGRIVIDSLAGREEES